MIIAVSILSSFELYQFVAEMYSLPVIRFSTGTWFLDTVGLLSRSWGILLALVGYLYVCLWLADKLLSKSSDERLFKTTLGMDLLTLIPISVVSILSML